jgi:hypothetical protein
MNNLPLQGVLDMVITMWAAISSVLLGLTVYCGILSLHEGSPLVLSEVTANSYSQVVHKIVVRMQLRIQPTMHAVSGAAAALSLLLVSTAVYNAAEILRARMH